MSNVTYKAAGCPRQTPSWEHLYLCALIGIAVTALPVRDHRLLHLDPLLAGQEDRASVDHGPRHEHHPGLRLGPAGDGPAGDRAGARHPRLLEARRRRPGRHLRGRGGGHGPALADRPDRRARRLRADHRQRRRDRRDGRPARGGAQRHGPARRGREHDQGGHQGLRDRLGGARGGRAVRRLPPGTRTRSRTRDELRDQRTPRADRAAARRHDGLPVRLAVDRGRRPGRRRRRRGGPPPVPREAGDHGGHRRARLRHLCGHRHADRPAGDDPALAAADRADADRRA